MHAGVLLLLHETSPAWPELKCTFFAVKLHNQSQAAPTQQIQRIRAEQGLPMSTMGVP